MVQLVPTRSSIKDLFKDLLDEIKGFKYQITVKVLLRKHKETGDVELAPVYFNSTTKTVISAEDSLDKSFQEVLCRIDNWINEKSGWTIESINGEWLMILIMKVLNFLFLKRLLQDCNKIIATKK